MLTEGVNSLAKDYFLELHENAEKARGWLQYDAFDFLTRPELRPDGPVVWKAIFQTIEKYRADLARLSVLRDLDDRQQLQLAALVLDYKAKYEDYDSIRKGIAELRKVPGLLGKRTLSRIEKTIELLRPIASRLPEEHPYAAGKRVKAILAALKRLPHQWTVPTRQELNRFIKWVRKTHPQPGDPTLEMTWQIFWFLVSRGGLHKNEAEVRVARIERHYYRRKVRYRKRYGGETRWKGSTTIRQRIRRFKTILQKKRRISRRISPPPSHAITIT